METWEIENPKEKILALNRISIGMMDKAFRREIVQMVEHQDYDVDPWEISNMVLYDSSLVNILEKNVNDDSGTLLGKFIL